MNHPEIYFHVGLPKTASTYLQNLVFPRLKGIHFFRKHKFDLYKAIDQFKAGEKYLFSTETDRGLEVKLEQYARVHPYARIIIVFRRQDQWIMSKYKYYVRKHGHLPFDRFFNAENPESFIKKEELFYADMIKLAEKFFPGKPLVLIFDNLKDNPQQFIKQITDFTGTEINYNSIPKRSVNTAFSRKQLSILQRFNSFYPYKELKTKKGKSKLHYRYRQYLLHTIAFFVNLVPSFMVKDYSMFPSKETIKKIEEFYKEDWEFCRNYSKL